MSDIDPRDWDGVMRSKLVKVLGASEGEQVYASLLVELKVSSIATLPKFLEASKALGRRGGFAATVGSLLSVHAMIHRA